MPLLRFYLSKLAREKAPKDRITGLNKNYVKGLTDQEKKEQIKEIEKSKKIYKTTGEVITRKKVSDAKHIRSPHVIKFENVYGFPITDITRVKKEFPNTDIDTILRKGRGAYASSGSRPNQTPDSWTYARLASVLTGGKAMAVDKDLIGDNDMKKILKNSA